MSDGAVSLTADQFRGLDPFDCREPGRCAVVVESRLNPVRFDGGDDAFNRLTHEEEVQDVAADVPARQKRSAETQNANSYP
jgi:hypothetical protein